MKLLENTKDIQKVLLNIYKDLDSVANELGVTVFFIGGSTIGAVRHSGFIPWDDDIDVALARNEYNILVNYLQKNLPLHYKLHWKKTGQHYVLMDTRYTLNYSENTKDSMLQEGDTAHPFIDLQPLDGVANGFIARKIHSFSVFFYRMCFKMSMSDRIHTAQWRSITQNFIIRILKCFSFLFSNQEKYERKYNELMNKYSFDQSFYIANFVGRYHWKDIYPKKWWIPARRMQFEDVMVNVPSDYDKYLTQLYGDYMKIPDNSNQESHLEN